VGIQGLFDLGDVFWKGSDFPLQLGNPQIQSLEAGDLLNVGSHLSRYFNILYPRSDFPNGT
jgi:hypothetical protein